MRLLLMESKWIRNVWNEFYNSLESGKVDKVEEILYSVDKLLRKAMFSTDDENLHDRIMKEIHESSDNRQQRI